MLHTAMNDRFDFSLLAIDTSDIIPLYHQIKQNLRDLIENEHLKEGDLLPSERELGEAYEVNRLTVRQAITELVSEGVLRRQRGVGTFVARPKLTQSLGRVLGFSERMIEAGRNPSSKCLSVEVIPASLNAARRLQIEPDTSIYRIVRLRCADGEPVMLETAFLTQARFPGLESVDFSNQSLYQVLADRYNCFVAEAEETLEPVIMTDYEVKMLEAEPGTPGMLVESISFDHSGRPLEIGKSIVRGDKSRFFFRIKRQVE